MPMLKTKWGHTAIAKRVDDYLLYGKKSEREKGIENYLGGASRALATDLINIWQRPDQTWGEAMDDARKGLYRRDNARTFAHIVLSPDKNDDVTLEQMRDLATTWAEEFFGMDDPAICAAQVAIVYHDDNAREIMHAHIIVNNVNLSPEGAGKSIRPTAKQWREMTSRAQELAWERGMRGFDASRKSVDAKHADRTELRGRAQKSERPTLAERNMGKDGRRSWKQEIREAIQVACNVSSTPEQVIAHLERAGIVCEPRRAKGVEPGSDFIFYYPQPGVPLEQNKKRVSGARLGRRCTRQGMVEQIRMSAYRRWAIEDRNDAGLADALVGYFRSDENISLDDLSASFNAVNILKVTTRDEAAKKLAVERAHLDKLKASGRPTTDCENHIKWLDAAVRTSAWIPETFASSKTAQARAAAGDRLDRDMKAALARGERITLDVKVERGYRLTKEEHAKLSKRPALLREWKENRKYGLEGRKRAGSSKSTTGTYQTQGRAQSASERSRGGRAR